MTQIETLISRLSLKEMGPDLLAEAIRIEAIKAHQDYVFTSVDKAIVLASYLHRKQTRANRGTLPRDMYITHPLRNALRLYRYGVTDHIIIVATILHDTVEDCAEEMSDLYGNTSRSEEQSRRLAVHYLKDQFGAEVARIVEAVSNPLPGPGASKLTQAQKRKAYADHVEIAIADPEVALVKFVDFVDNAFGLKHNDPILNAGMIAHLSQKYLPLVPVFKTRLAKGDVQALMSPAGYRQIEKQIAEGSASLANLAILR
jgi:(p)ppGpp synthase/HD superfamily hydrolase